MMCSICRAELDKYQQRIGKKKHLLQHKLPEKKMLSEIQLERKFRLVITVLRL